MDAKNVCPINEQVYRRHYKTKLMAIGVWRSPWRLEEASNEQFVFEGGLEWES